MKILTINKRLINCIIKKLCSSKDTIQRTKGNRKGVSFVYLINDLYLKYIKNFYKAVRKRQLIFKNGQKT